MDVERFWCCQRCGAAGKMDWSVCQAFPSEELVRIETPLQKLRRERRENEFQERWQQAREDGCGDDAA